jgi:hypothetical protein
MALNPSPINVLPTPLTPYRVAWGRLLLLLLPSLLRRPKLLAWLQALNFPADQLYTQFIVWLLDTRRELSYNGQTILLEKALNDRFDPSRRRVVIRNDDTDLLPIYLNFVREQQPLPVLHFQREQQPRTYWRRYLEILRQVGFTVYAPGLMQYERQLNARIRRLKLAVVRYRLLYSPAP